MAFYLHSPQKPSSSCYVTFRFALCYSYFVFCPITYSSLFLVFRGGFWKRKLRRNGLEKRRLGSWYQIRISRVKTKTVKFQGSFTLSHPLCKRNERFPIIYILFESSFCFSCFFCFCMPHFANFINKNNDAIFYFTLSLASPYNTYIVISCTNYWNIILLFFQITKLKIDSNPFAKGFRDSSRLTDFDR